MQCSYEKDANTAGVSPSCRAARKHSRRSGSVAPLDTAVCIPGCEAAGCQLKRGYRCNASEGRAKQLHYTLEAQVRRSPFSYDATKLKRLPGRRHHHNEVIFNASCLRARLPHSVVAVVRNVHPTPSYPSPRLPSTLYLQPPTLHPLPSAPYPRPPTPSTALYKGRG
eukprot:scaffold31141_cov57-Phaeocystis_antarctica.AAC.2